MVENEQTLMISPTRRSTRRRQVDATDTVRRDDVAALTKAKPHGGKENVGRHDCCPPRSKKNSQGREGKGVSSVLFELCHDGMLLLSHPRIVPLRSFSRVA